MRDVRLGASCVENRDFTTPSPKIAEQNQRKSTNSSKSILPSFGGSILSTNAVDCCTMSEKDEIYSKPQKEK
jgi:hypothetical protein